MQVLNALNVNLELLRPECDGPTTPYDNMVFTLATPFAFIAVIVVYAAIRTAINAHVARLAHPPESEESWLEGFKAREHQLDKKLVAACSAIFSFGTIFFIRACLRPFKCIGGDDGIGERFMASNPEVVCSDDNEMYTSMIALGYTGLAVYAVVFLGLVVCLLLAASMLAKAHYTDLGMLGNFSFLGNKYEPSWFFWESAVIARSVGLLLAFFVFEGQDSWLAATAVVGVALLAHTAVRPYEDDMTDVVEMLCLVVLLYMLVSVPVFVELGETEGLDAPPAGSKAQAFIELGAIALLVSVCVTVAYAQLRLFRSVMGEDREQWWAREEDKEPYEKRMLQDRVERFKQQAERAEARLTSYLALLEKERSSKALANSPKQKRPKEAKEGRLVRNPMNAAMRKRKGGDAAKTSIFDLDWVPHESESDDSEDNYE